MRMRELWTADDLGNTYTYPYVFAAICAAIPARIAISELPKPAFAHIVSNVSFSKFR